MNFIKTKKIITILMFVAMQPVMLQAMLLQTGRAVFAASRRTLSSAASQSLPAYAAHKSSSDDTQKNSRLLGLCAAGSVITAVALASLAQKLECSADEIENPYGPEFLKKAGFTQGLPYWYLVRFAQTFANHPLNDDLHLKVKLDDYITTYQPCYLSQADLVPVWDGRSWQHRSGALKDYSTDMSALCICIVDKNEHTVASCYLTPAGRMRNIHVDRNCRGKGYGRLLLSVTKQIALEAGISKLYLHVWPYDLNPGVSRREAWISTIRFYQKNGFSPDRMFCFEHAESWNDSDYSRMVYNIHSDEKTQSLDEHACRFCDTTERVKATLTLSACLAVAVAGIRWCCRKAIGASQ